MTLTLPEPATVGAAISDAEALDDACLDMQPLARRLINAVHDRDQQAVADAFAAIYGFDAPAGRSPLAVLALVLADEVVHARRTTATIRAERERCIRLAVNVATAPIGAVPGRARMLPTLIAQGVRP